MLRNVGGSIGISLSTALVMNRAQVRQAYLVTYLSPLWQPYNETLQQLRDSLGVTEVISFLEETWNIAVPEEDVTEMNFGTLGGISRYVAQQLLKTED